MIATVFTLRVLAAGPIVGAALVCPEARYFSVKYRVSERLDRRFATVTDWKAIEAELADLPGGPLPTQSAIVRVLGREGEIVVQYLSTEELDAAPADVARTLDARLDAGAILRATRG